MSLSPEQKKLRKQGIFGSEIAAVLGLSPYATPLDVWRSKVEGLEIEETAPMKRGRILEPAIADWYAEDTGAVLSEVGTLVHPTRKLIGATPDRIARFDDHAKVLEIKSANSRMADKWGEAGTDDVPQHYIPQVQLEMGCAGLPLADLAVLIGGDDFRIYHLAFDPELFGMMADAAEKFWVDHVKTGIPPPLDGSDSCADWLKAKYPADRAPILNAPPEAAQWAEQLRNAKVLSAQAEAQEKEARNQLVAMIGDAAGIKGDGWSISYKKGKGRESIDWKAVAAEAGVSAALIQRHTKTTEFRTFRPTFKGDK